MTANNGDRRQSPQVRGKTLNVTVRPMRFVEGPLVLSDVESGATRSISTVVVKTALTDGAVA